MTSSETRRGSSSLSMRLHSDIRSQSAVIDPTRLAVPFEAMMSALYQNNAGTPFCMFVAGDVFIERRTRRHARFLEFHQHERQTVHESDQIRPAGVERPGDCHLTNEKEI